MHGKVKQLRNRGVRLSDRDIANLPATQGELVMAAHQWSMERVMSLRSPNDSVSPPLIPDLCDVRLMGLQNGKMLLKGVERPQGEDGPEYIQEWTVVVAPR
jgi:hypothetical protein